MKYQLANPVAYRTRFGSLIPDYAIAPELSALIRLTIERKLTSDEAAEKVGCSTRQWLQLVRGAFVLSADDYQDLTNRLNLSEPGTLGRRHV